MCLVWYRRWPFLGELEFVEDCLRQEIEKQINNFTYVKVYVKNKTHGTGMNTDLYHFQQWTLLWPTKACASILSLCRQLQDTMIVFVKYEHVNRSTIEINKPKYQGTKSNHIKIIALLPGCWYCLHERFHKTSPDSFLLDLSRSQKMVSRILKTN